MKTFAVIGAGHGGQAMAGFLGLLGYKVNLFNKTGAKLAPIIDQGGIWLEGKVEGFGPLQVISDQIGDVLRGADVIMVAIPASGHRQIAELCAPYLTGDQIVILNPGRTGGAIEFRHTLGESGCREAVTVAEAQTFIFASRIAGPAKAKIFGFKQTVAMAALPSIETGRVLRAVRPAFPQFRPAANVLETSLDNMGAILHPALTILNSGWIEGTGGAFDYYHQGVSPSVAQVLEAMDEERLSLARVLGVKARSAGQWLTDAYGAVGRGLREAILNNAQYTGIKAPDTLDHRYIFEDVPASLVPMAELGQLLEVPTPTINSIIQLASTIHGVDYRAIGRTIDRLGLRGMSVDDIWGLVWLGEGPSLCTAGD